MAAVTVPASAPMSSSPPSSAPAHRKPLPLQNLSTTSSDWAEEGRPLPSIPAPSSSARLRQPPVSPVRVNFQPENWAQPSNVNIEEPPAYTLSNDPVPEQDPFKTLSAPTPPPHTPQAQGIMSFPTKPPTAAASSVSRDHQNENRPLPILSVRSMANADQGTASSPVQDRPPSLAVSHSMPEVAATKSPRLDGTATPDADGVRGDGRQNRETNLTAAAGQQHASAESSATTSTSSVSGVNEVVEPADMSPESSLEDGIPGPEPVPQLQYHHQAFLPHSVSMNALAQPEHYDDPRSSSNPDFAGNDSPVNRHLTPNSNIRRSSLPRPQSAYSVYSDLGSRGRSPGLYGSNMRAPSSQSRKSPDMRPSSYADMLNVPYPQPGPAPLNLDNAALRHSVGTNASLLSTQKTLEMYRQNVKKTTDMSIQYSFAVFLISTAQEQGLSFDDSTKRKNSPKPIRDLESPYVESSGTTPHELVREARSILQRLSNAGYPFAQYYLADGYASGLFSKGKEDYNAAFPLFVLAAKHGHAESAYRTALCYEFGWGCRKDPAKAVQFLRSAASKRHPGAMTRLGKACLSGDLGEKRYREGLKWLKLATESADAIYNAAPYHLGCLYETGYGDDVFKDESYTAELFTQAAELGHPDANFRMGDAYEHGKLNCPRDPALSVHFYTGAAERGHPAAMMGLCAWYMVGAEPLLEKDEEEAYEWAYRSAELGFVKAQYAVGYFTEMGIGCRRDILEANVWYVKAADAGDERAKQRLAAIRAAVSGDGALAGGIPMEVSAPRNGKVKKNANGKDESCVLM